MIDNHGILWTFILGAVVTILFTLPMLPSMIELYWPKDDRPLKVVREFDGNIANFAIGFDGFIKSELGGILRSIGADSVVRNGILNSGEPYTLLGQAAQFSLTQEERAVSTVNQMVIGAGNLELPGNVTFLKEIYASNEFACGSQTILRAVLSNGRISLDNESAILRWAHAKGEFIAAHGVQIQGRASSDSGMKLAEGVIFERLYAPRISFGKDMDQLNPSFLAGNQLSVWEPGNQAQKVGNQWRLKTDVSIPPEYICKAILVSGGSLSVGRDSWMTSAIKGKKNLILGDRCRCDDAVIAGARLEIGEGCRIKGPIISESVILLRRGCIVGSADKPTSVTAPQILIEPGVVVFGTIWAREHGVVEKQA